jgi:putative oxidoreductase
MKNYIAIALRILLALPFIIFGLNKFLMFASMPPPADPTAQAFLGAMFTSYLFKLVAITEILAGTFLLFGRTSLLGSILLLPITVNIAWFHLAHDNPGNGIWLFTTLLHVAVIYTQSERFAKLFDVLFDNSKAEKRIGQIVTA